MSEADDLIQQLRAAADGLLYPSESDEPFTAFAWPKRLVRIAAGRPWKRTPAGRRRFNPRP